jgi:hypothetical protein
MSVYGSIELMFGGDVRRFRLGIDNLIALQSKLDSGPMEIVNRFRANTWRVQDVQETLRIGLIGGYGPHPTTEQAKAAQKLIEENVRAGNVVPHVLTAMAVLLAALQGDPDNPVGKRKRRRRAPAASASPPPHSTEPEQR